MNSISIIDIEIYFIIFLDSTFVDAIVCLIHKGQMVFFKFWSRSRGFILQSNSLVLLGFLLFLESS